MATKDLSLITEATDLLIQGYLTDNPAERKRIVEQALEQSDGLIDCAFRKRDVDDLLTRASNKINGIGIPEQTALVDASIAALKDYLATAPLDETIKFSPCPSALKKSSNQL